MSERPVAVLTIPSIMQKTYHALGLMSGSSLDGLDIAFTKFVVNTTADALHIDDWQLLAADTLPFSEQWQARLLHLPRTEALAFAKTHTYFGHYTAELVNGFLKKQNIDPDFIAAHGHTVFHYPEENMTTQIGDGAALAALTGYPVISDFRSQDVASGGEGAPLAPLADKLLFSEYDFFLNIGGIINISCNANGKFVAFDITAANQLLNALALQLGQAYDAKGVLAARGEVIERVLEDAAKLPYFSQPYPKSLDNQWVRKHILPFFVHPRRSVEDRLRTSCEHIAQQTAQALAQIVKAEKLDDQKNYRLLVTGGGAFNTFLVQTLQKHCQKILDIELIVPEKNVVEFKEAILMGLMGVLRLENVPNCLQTVTGAQRNVIGGAVHQGWKKQV